MGSSYNADTGLPFEPTFSELNVLSATRYLSGVALTVSLYDHVLIFDRELALVWQQPWSLLSLLVLLYSYVRESGLLYTAYVMGGMRPPLTTTECGSFIKFMGFYGVLNVGVVQFLVLYRVYVVWDNRTRIRNALLSGYALAIAAGIVFTIIAVVQVAPHSLYSSELGSCLFTTKSYYLIGSWSAMLFYDIYVSLLLVGNSLNKPRRHNTEILRNLYRDGILSFLCLFGLQLAKLVPSIVGGPSDMLLTPLIAWSLDGVIVMRLFLKVRDIEVNARKGFGWKSVTMLDSKTQPQVPVLVFEEVEMEVI